MRHTTHTTLKTCLGHPLSLGFSDPGLVAAGRPVVIWPAPLGEPTQLSKRCRVRRCRVQSPTNPWRRIFEPLKPTLQVPRKKTHQTDPKVGQSVREPRGARTQRCSDRTETWKPRPTSWLQSSQVFRPHRPSCPSRAPHRPMTPEIDQATHKSYSDDTYSL